MRAIEKGADPVLGRNHGGGGTEGLGTKGLGQYGASASNDPTIAEMARKRRRQLNVVGGEKKNGGPWSESETESEDGDVLMVAEIEKEEKGDKAVSIMQLAKPDGSPSDFHALGEAIAKAQGRRGLRNSPSPVQNRGTKGDVIKRSPSPDKLSGDANNAITNSDSTSGSSSNRGSRSSRSLVAQQSNQTSLIPAESSPVITKSNSSLASPSASIAHLAPMMSVWSRVEERGKGLKASQFVAFLSALLDASPEQLNVLFQKVSYIQYQRSLVDKTVRRYRLHLCISCLPMSIILLSLRTTIESGFIVLYQLRLNLPFFSPLL